MWGSNYSGQSGDGTTIQRAEPTKVTNLTEVQAIASGGHHNSAR
ncbi:hypothetical protein [Caballeronia sp. PC1]